MADLVVETRGLRKEYRIGRRRLVAVDDLELLVPGGAVHGFLGPNGSGKTTTLKMLLGLARPTAGEMRLFGQPVPGALPRVRRRVGAVVDRPRFLPGLSGRRNLALLAGAAGVADRRVEEVLDRVGLAERGRDPYRSYSLGMRQRLGLASALLASPDLVVLDEPTHGLDPAGVRDVRELIRELGRSGVTVLLSSHVLAEVQQVCDSVSVVGAGRLLGSGSVEELVGRETPGAVRVGVAEAERAAGHLRDAGFRVSVDHARRGTPLHVEGVRDPAEVTRVLAGHRLYVRELVAARPDPESVFLELTGEGGGSG